MNERVVPQKSSGNSGQTLKNWGMLFMLAGVIGQSVIWNRVIGLNGLDYNGASAFMDESSANMVLVISSILLRAVSCCAMPLFLFLLVEGVAHTSNYGFYFLRITALALVSEIPYDLAIYNRPFYWADQNPVFGLVLAMVIIYFLKTYGKGILRTVLLSLFIFAVGCVWVFMLKIADGYYMLFMTFALFLPRNRRAPQLYIGALVACMSVTIYNFEAGNTVPSLVYLLSPLAFLLIFRYNDEQGEGSRMINYAAYPVLLLCGWFVGFALF